MKKFILLLTVLTIGFTNQIKASHHLGGEIKVDFIGGNDYLVSVNFYVTCGGILPEDSIFVNFNSGCGNFISCFYKFGNPVNIPTTCSSQLTNCNGGTLYGVQKYVYRKQVTLAPCSDWTISWTSGSRSPCNNLYLPTSQNWYYYFTFNSLLAPNNHFPYFTTDPINIIKEGSTFHYNHGAIDPDGDSLSYSMVAPLQAAGLPVNYLSPWTFSNPMPSNPPVYEDQVTGDMVINPTQSFIATYAVEVTEWKTIAGTPTVISKQIRDNIINVLFQTADEIPVLAGINTLATTYNVSDTAYRIPVIAGDTIDFDIYAHKPVPADMNLTFPKQIPGSTLNVTQNNTPNVKGHFHWVPTSTQIVKGPALFLACISDSSCPYFYYQIYSYSFDVGGLIVFLLPGNTNVNLLLGQSYNISATCAPANTFDWYVDGTMVQSGSSASYQFFSQNLGPGDHTVGCKAYNSAKSNLQGFEFVNVHVENVWSIDQAADPNMGIYPNPTNDILNIKTDLKIESLKLFDNKGRLIQTYSASARQIDFSLLSRGVYILSINNNIYRKIILI